MTSQRAAEIRSRKAPWRFAFVIYAASLVTATHWPELSLGSGSSPWPDKLTHMAAFGGLAVLLVLTGWLRAWIALCLAAVWTVADELTQSIPILGRTMSPQDALAGLAGVGAVAAWTAALGPVGGAASRLRRDWLEFLLGTLATRWTAWVLTAAASLAAAAAAGAAVQALLERTMALTPAEANPWALLAAGLAGLAAAHAVVAIAARRLSRQARQRQPCFRCGESCRGLAFDEFGRGRCTGCGTSIHRGQWTEPMELPAGVVLRDAAPALMLAVALVLFMILVYGVLLAASARFSFPRHLITAWDRAAPDLQLSLDLAALAVIAAAAVAVYRRRDARRCDLQHRRCRRCGHDLSETPLELGEGRCGECGLRFVRVAEQPEAGTSDQRSAIRDQGRKEEEKTGPIDE